jgi:hypothetical protein
MEYKYKYKEKEKPSKNITGALLSYAALFCRCLGILLGAFGMYPSFLA